MLDAEPDPRRLPRVSSGTSKRPNVPRKARRWTGRSRVCCRARQVGKPASTGCWSARGISSRGPSRKATSRRTPFKRGGQVVVRLTKESPRDRRLVESADARQPGEEERLLKSAGPHLRDLIIAGIATGCRVGELLALQWKDVRVTTGPKGQTRQSLVLPAGKTKTNTTREVPVGSRLAAVLDMRRHAPDGTRLGPEAYVFGNEVGERIGSVKKAWQTAVLKAHGHTPQWVKGKNNQLAPESLAAYRAINLHFHDLRREFGSRVLESGSSLIEARDLLGHANISQTSTYLQSTAKALGWPSSGRKRTSGSLQTRADAKQRKIPTRRPNVTIRCRRLRRRQIPQKW